MGKTTEGAFRVPGGFKIQNAYPVDDRMTVNTDADLLDDSVLPDLYEGIIVYSKSSKTHYTWVSGNRALFENWKKIGEEQINYTANNGVKLENDNFSVDNTVVKTSGTQTITGSKTIQSDLYFNNQIYLRHKKSNGVSTRTHGINSSNIEYIGSIDSDVSQTYIGNKTSKLFLRTNNFTRLTVDEIGRIGIGRTSSAEKLEVQGNILATSNMIAQTFAEGSLRKLKENIQPFKKSGLDKVNNLKIVTFDKINGPKNKIGIIADDTDEDFLTDEKNAVDLYKTIFLQAKAIQELSNKISKLESLITTSKNNG